MAPEPMSDARLAETDAALARLAEVATEMDDYGIYPSLEWLEPMVEAVRAGKDLRAEVEQLRTRVAELEAEGIETMADRFMEETRIRSMEIRNGMNLELEPARELVAEWVGAARTMLGDAPNYTETPCEIPTDRDPKVTMEVKIAEDPQMYAFVLQRVGKLTPHQARMKAEAERDRVVEAARPALESLDLLLREYAEPGMRALDDRHNLAHALISIGALDGEETTDA